MALDFRTIPQYDAQRRIESRLRRTTSMTAIAIALAPIAKGAFPLAEVQGRLRGELVEAEAESVILHPGWQPVLDSLRMVTAIATVEGLFDFKLPPEKVVKKGGYKTVDEGVSDMTNRIREVWTKRQQ
jgi:acyl carrier protein